MKMIPARIGWALGIGLVAVLGLLFAAGCGDDDDDGNGDGDETPVATEDGSMAEDEQALQDTIEGAAAAWNAGDVDAFLAFFTDAGVMSSFDAPREAAMEFLTDFIGDPPITVGTLTNISISGDAATADAADFAFGKVIDANTFSFAREGDSWLIDNEEDLAVEPPEGTTVVDVSLLEYQFSFDPAEITNGNIAFAASNIGGEDHEIAIVEVAPDAVIEEVIADEAFFETANIVGVGGPWPPGTETNVVFTEEFAPGRYAMLCFIENSEGTPHAFLGMVDEFTIE